MASDSKRAELISEITKLQKQQSELSPEPPSTVGRSIKSFVLATPLNWCSGHLEQLRSMQECLSTGRCCRSSSTAWNSGPTATVVTPVY